MRPRPFLMLPLLLAGLAALPAVALVLAMPGPAQETGLQEVALGDFAMPVGAWDGSSVPVRVVEGRVERRAWRVDAPGMPVLQLAAPLRDQLAAAGFATVYECADAECGGFDFRFATEVLPEPQMHVDLGDYRYLAATRGDEAVSLLVSRSANAGFVQMTRVAPAALPPPELYAAAEEDDEEVLRGVPGPATVSLSSAGVPDGGVAARLEATGAAVLDDLRFDPGASAVSAGDYGSLAGLAAWLAADPVRRLALVGHTDASGGLEANIAVSRERAESVKAVLVARYGADGGRIDAEGVGYLAPLAPNDTEEGRARNRRVEAVVVAP